MSLEEGGELWYEEVPESVVLGIAVEQDEETAVGWRGRRGRCGVVQGEEVRRRSFELECSLLERFRKQRSHSAWEAEEGREQPQPSALERPRRKSTALSLLTPPSNQPSMFTRRARTLVQATRRYSTPSTPAAAAQQTPKAPKGTDSSTSASDYKLAHPRRRPPALPTIDPPRWSAEEAVNNILYNSEFEWGWAGEGG